MILERKRKGERVRERYIDLDVPWLGMEPATLAYGDGALTNWAAHSCDCEFCHRFLFLQFFYLSWSKHKEKHFLFKGGCKCRDVCSLYFQNHFLNLFSAWNSQTVANICPRALRLWKNTQNSHGLWKNEAQKLYTGSETEEQMGRVNVRASVARVLALRGLQWEGTPGLCREPGCPCSSYGGCTSQCPILQRKKLSLKAEFTTKVLTNKQERQNSNAALSTVSGLVRQPRLTCLSLFTGFSI